MPRFFLEVSYKGTRYSGFQVQENAVTIQSVVEDAMCTLYRQHLPLTGSSRTDAGVHARQNFFHFDTQLEVSGRHIYNLNAILPEDIAATGLYSVDEAAHCRFAADWREYRYFIYNKKNPFLVDRAWYYPYTLDPAVMEEAAAILLKRRNYIAFSKRNSQVNNYLCDISISEWQQQEDGWVYRVRANRFLRGMVRALVATMLKVGRGHWSMAAFQALLEEGAQQSSADFSAPAHGLSLMKVHYPAGLLHRLS